MLETSTGKTTSLHILSANNGVLLLPMSLLLMKMNNKNKTHSSNSVVERDVHSAKSPTKPRRMKDSDSTEETVVDDDASWMSKQSDDDTEC